MGNENKIASGNGNGNEPGSGNASGCSLIEPFSPISINIPAFRKKEIDISYIVSEFSQGTINEEDLEYLIEIQSPNPNPNPNRYSPSYQAPPSSSLPPPPLSNIQVHNNQHKCKIRFGEKAELLLYDGNESCTSILPAKKNNQNELEKIESTSNLSANITFCVDDYKKIHRSNSFFSDSIGRRISRSLSKLSLSSQDKEKKKDKDKETEVGTEVETETDMNLVEAESEDDQISKSNYQQHQQSSNQQSFHQQFQQRPILKNKINDNSEQENIRAQKCDEVDFNSFMNFFEEHERRRMVFEPCLGQAREEQLLKYYNTMSPSPELACPFNNEESSDVSSNNYYI
ncbi:hypothetical protein PACTADRAFT_73740 [Pachysolen tannophilus NRRL Y-2460]|uniref:Uncharacterized protein n=1 Tax=Pachysolen tannophilus NRRL Y-2460 TaxID=669874 RepID=A0A1E4U2A1_PACTA|nr:hypothetical protein PACTADRAFT_73740 [Pachysolen tannophilus NRRL Y-2460]